MIPKVLQVTIPGNQILPAGREGSFAATWAASLRAQFRCSNGCARTIPAHHSRFKQTRILPAQQKPHSTDVLHVTKLALARVPAAMKIPCLRLPRLSTDSYLFVSLLAIVEPRVVTTHDRKAEVGMDRNGLALKRRVAKSASGDMLDLRVPRLNYETFSTAVAIRKVVFIGIPLTKPTFEWSRTIHYPIDKGAHDGKVPTSHPSFSIHCAIAQRDALHGRRWMRGQRSSAT